MKHNRPIMRALTILITCFLFGGLTAKAEKRPWVKIENNVMTFLYGEKETLQENEYWLNEGKNAPAWSDKRSDVTKAVFDASFKDARPATCYRWFALCKNMTSIDGLENLNTSEVTNMKSMFYYCGSLQSIDLMHFDTRNVTDMESMFEGCYSLASLDISSFNTSGVTTMESMFDDAINLQHIFVGDKFTTANVASSNWMFMGCELLSGAVDYQGYGKYDAAYANTATGYLTDAKQKSEAKYYWTKFSNDQITIYYGKKESLGNNEYFLKTGSNSESYAQNPNSANVFTAVLDKSLKDAMPTHCCAWFTKYENLTRISGLENLNTAQMTDMSGMFYKCASLENLDLSSFNTSNVTSMRSMFSGCKNLQELNLSGFDTSNVTDMGSMFDGCYSLPRLDLSSFNTQDVTNMSLMFFNCMSLNRIFVTDRFNTDKVEADFCSQMFDGCYSIRGAIEYQNGEAGLEYANTKTGYLTDASFISEAKYGWTKIDGTTLTFYYTKKDKLEEGEMFLTAGYKVYPNEITNVTKAVFDESFKEARPVSCTGWFIRCKSLADIEGWENVNLEKADDTRQMFYNCESLRQVDLSTLNTEIITDMNSMFSGCANLKSIYLGDKFNTSKVEDADNMFEGCHATLYCPANSYAALSASKILEGRDLMAYANINPAAEYGTLCVPQGSDLAADTFEGFDKLYSVSKVEGDKALLKEEKQLEPGKAYIYHRNLPADYFKAVIAYKPNGAAAAEPLTDALLRGTFLETTAPSNSYVLNDDALLHLAAADGTTTVGANEAYLLEESGTTLPSTLSLKIDDASGINGVIDESEAAGNNRVYDLMGRRVSTLVKGGIYIRNGKKIQL